MRKRPKIALTVSQHFDRVYPQLSGLVDALVIRDINNVPPLDVEKIFHLNGFINDDFDKTIEKKFFGILKNHNIRFLSFDLGPSCRRVRVEEFYKAESPVLTPEEILQTGAEKLRRIRSFYSGAISLENLDYHGGGAYEYVCDPAFIKAAIEEFDTSLTIDIGHLNVSCFQLGIDPKDYIHQLPMYRLKEVHISHSNENDDSHHIPKESDYALLDYILSISKPEYIVLEFFQDPGIIIEEHKRLWKRIQNGKTNRKRSDFFDKSCV